LKGLLDARFPVSRGRKADEAELLPQDDAKTEAARQHVGPGER